MSSTSSFDISGGGVLSMWIAGAFHSLFFSLCSGAGAAFFSSVAFGSAFFGSGFFCAGADFFCAGGGGGGGGAGGAETDESQMKLASTSPKRSLSPLLTTAAAMRAPLTKVPFVLPRSVRVHTPSCGMRVQ